MKAMCFMNAVKSVVLGIQDKYSPLHSLKILQIYQRSLLMCCTHTPANLKTYPG
jgi:hypothetical protein